MIRKAKDSRLTYIVVFSAAGIVIIAAAYFFFGRPAFKYSADMRKRFVSYQDQLQKAEELIRSLPNPQKALDEIERKNEQFSEESGSGKQLPKIIQALGQSAAGRQINVVSIKQKEELKTGNQNLPAGVSKLYFEMTFNAPYQEVGEYAKFLCSMPGVFTIETMTLARQEREPSKPGDRSGMLSASFIISTYMVGDL